MRKTLTRFATSFAALLSDSHTQVDVAARIEDIRTAMFDALWALDVQPSEVWKAIERAREVQTLWYLRSDLFLALSAASGEYSARITLDKITEMFRGVVPKNQMSAHR